MKLLKNLMNLHPAIDQMMLMINYFFIQHRSCFMLNTYKFIFILSISFHLNCMNLNGDANFVKAINNNDIETINKMINEGYNINKKNEIGQTPVFLVSRYGKEKLLKTFINSGADVTVKDNDGNNSLMVSKNTEITRILIKK